MNKLLDTVRKIYHSNKKQIVILAVVAIMLILLSVLTTTSDSLKETNNSTDAVSSLEADLEKKLEEFLTVVEGVGKVKVCVTYDVLEQVSYARNSEVDTDDGSKKIKENYVIVDGNNGEEKGLKISVRTPEIRGVAIACEGGASAAVRSDITSLVCSVLGISSNRVFVSQYNKTNNRR